MVECWGDDENGQSTPPSTPFSQIAAGRYHTCGLGLDGLARCWGAISTDGTLVDRGQATPQSGTFTQISAGALHTCALNVDGTVQCWGEGGEEDEGNCADPDWNCGQSTAP